MVKILDKVIKDNINSNKYKSGAREVIQSVRNSKLIIVSKSLTSSARSQLEEKARDSNVPIYYFDGNSVKLGKLCNKPFRITAIALKAGTEREIDSILATQLNEKEVSKTK
jgi:large subunit ribosomal protein L30e